MRINVMLGWATVVAVERFGFLREEEGDAYVPRQLGHCCSTGATVTTKDEGTPFMEEKQPQKQSTRFTFFSRSQPAGTYGQMTLAVFATLYQLPEVTFR